MCWWPQQGGSESQSTIHSMFSGLKYQTSYILVARAEPFISLHLSLFIVFCVFIVFILFFCYCSLFAYYSINATCWLIGSRVHNFSIFNGAADLSLREDKSAVRTPLYGAPHLRRRRRIVCECGYNGPPTGVRQWMNRRRMEIIYINWWWIGIYV